jgi:hypothetical protein
MSGSCYNNEEFQLKVGLKVGHTYCSNLDHDFKIEIVRQWNVNLFEGGKNCRYMFASTGTCLGYPGYTGTANRIGWYLIDIPTFYEYRIISGYFVSPIWNNVKYNISINPDEHYLVRQRGNPDYLQLMNHVEFRNLKERLK